MAILKCKMCGGDIELSADKTFGTCEYCGSTMTFPKVDDEQRAAMFNRGNHFRRIGEFDKALAVYERIVQEDENDAEAHWCCALCRFGIEYVEDPNTFEYLPTCHRASFDSFLEDVDYLAALEHSDGITRRQYQKDAQKIAEVQRGILATSRNEEPFDVFLCYKETEDDGSRTRDSLYAQDIYYQLTEQGRRVFFSRITLEDKAGTEYEPYIFAALNSAKVMILVTTSADHANAVWVKNEWSRFLSLMRKDRSKLLLPCYRDMDPYDLPEALSVLQSYDMSKIGFIQDLIRGVNKVLNGTKPKQTAKETVVIQQANANVAPLLKRAFMFLEDGDWNNANEYCEKVLDHDPENALAYVGKLMAELHVNRREQLKDQPQPFNNKNNYQKALRFADSKLKAELTSTVDSIIDRNETSRKEGIYQQALAAIERESVEGYKEAARLFESVPDYKDSADRVKECLEQVIIIPKKNTYQAAIVMMANGDENDYRSAASMFKSITGYKDAVAMEKECLEKAEFARKEKLYQKSISLDYSASQISTRLSADWGASNALDGGISRATDNWFCAIEGFKSLGEFKDSQEQADTCVEKLYSFLCSCLEKSRDLHQLQVASESFQKLGNYKYALDKAQICSEKKEACRKDMLYSSAIKTMNEAGLSIDSLELAIREFRSVSGWQNADELAETCRRRIEQIRAQAEAARIEAERKAEAERLEAKRKAEAERQAEIKRARTKKILLSLSVVAALLIGSFVFLKTVYEPQQAYDQAVQLYNAKQYEESIAAFDALGSYRDSANQSKRIKEEVAAAELAKKVEEENAAAYAEAEKLLQIGDFDKAIAGFSGLGNYRDSNEKLEEARNAVAYAQAEDLLKTKRYDEAIAAFSSLGSYKDSEQRAESATNEKYMTTYSRAESFIKEGKLYEAATIFYSIQDYKDSRKRCFDLWSRITDRRTIAVGSHHTVALRTDGTLIGAYDGDKWSSHSGACSFSDWVDIIAVAAGSSHTVGLKTDGTVVATGWYTVFGWEDIVAIAAGNGFTVGLKADGTVVAKGDNDRGQCNVTGWNNIVAIAAGDNHTLGLRADGTVCAVGYNYSGQCDVQNWTGIVKIAAGMTNSVGLRANGSVVIVGDNDEGQKEAENWRDIVDIAAGPYHIAGVQSNGKALAVGSDHFGLAAPCAVEDWTNIVSIAAGEKQTVGLRADGTVVAAGSYTRSRDTSSWKGIKTK